LPVSGAKLSKGGADELNPPMPLIICEGQTDAISTTQPGVNRLGMCGANLADFDLDLVKLFGSVYVWPDATTPTAKRAKPGKNAKIF
jgi:hypothetical protein